MLLTHRGWFGICPVYFGNLDSDGPLVEPRHWSVLWLMPLSEAIWGAAFAARGMIDPAFVPQWPLVITGELHPPITIDGEL